MIRALTLTLLLVIADLTFADDAKSRPTAAEDSAAQAQQVPPPGVLPTPAPREDSALVQAARRANRLGKKPATIIITNESVKNNSGRITTTSKQFPVSIPKGEPSVHELAVRRAKSEAEQKARLRVIGEDKERRESAEKLQRQAQAIELAEEGYYENPDEDPARSEHDAEEALREQADQKPPLH